MIKPQIHIDTKTGSTKYEFFSTYKELKKNLVKVFNKYNVNQLFVIRSRRGEWGEWWEYWEINSKSRPFITKSGWS
jgi:hypothetical protein